MKYGMYLSLLYLSIPVWLGEDVMCPFCGLNNGFAWWSTLVSDLPTSHHDYQWYSIVNISSKTLSPHRIIYVFILNYLFYVSMFPVLHFQSFLPWRTQKQQFTWLIVLQVTTHHFISHSFWKKKIQKRQQGGLACGTHTAHIVSSAFQCLFQSLDRLQVWTS